MDVIITRIIILASKQTFFYYLYKQDKQEKPKDGKYLFQDKKACLGVHVTSLASFKTNMIWDIYIEKENGE